MSEDDDDYSDAGITPFVQNDKPDLGDLEEHDLKAASTKASQALEEKNNTVHVFDDENLGENFEETPWVPPSIAKALEHKQKVVLKGGHASLYHVNICRESELGAGTALYFQFLRSMGVCMFVMTLLSIPTLFFAFWGSRMSIEDRDSTNFYRFALGNVGYNKESDTYYQDTVCKSSSRFYNANETCIQLPNNMEISLSQAGFVFTICEILQIFVFFCTLWHIRRRVFAAEKEMSRTITSVADYSIQVKGFSKDTTEHDLITFFSNLYPLDKEDWLKRPGLAGARPVESVENTHDPRYMGTWIAECFMMRKIGKILDAFLDQEQLTRNLRHYRAQAKMYAEGTTHANGPNAKKYEKAMKKVHEYAVKVDMMAHKLIKFKSGPKKEGDVEAPAENHESHHSAHESAQEIINKFDPVVAYVTFEYSESMARCVEDFDKYSRFPFFFFYPDQLRLKGKRLTVHQAPEPDQILFENLEVPTWKKYIVRFIVNSVAFILLLICFAIIVQGSIYKSKFSKEIPNLGFCGTQIPLSYGFSHNITTISDWSLYRPPAGVERDVRDEACSTLVLDSFYAVMAKSPETYETTMVPYDYSSCIYTNSYSGNGLCPHARGQINNTYCPCVATKSTEICSTIECSTISNVRGCRTYEAGVVGSCYCFQNLISMIEKDGPSATISYIKTAKQDVCYNFFIDYSTASGITYGATVITVVVNAVMKMALERLTKYEMHADMDKMQASLMFKTFLATFFNMALVVLIAFGYINSMPDALKKASIFQGVYHDFTSNWYGVVGAYLVLTYAIQVVSAPIGDFINFLFLKPLARCCYYPHISSQSSYKVAMQSELDAMEVGPVFDIVTNTAQMLTLVFFAMTYAAGLPVLIPVACITFIVYFSLYKRLILRYFKKPPEVAGGIIEKVVAVLPYAAMLRLAFSIWMLSNTDILPATFPVFTASASGVGGDKLGDAGSKSYGSSNYLKFVQTARDNAPSDPSLAAFVIRLSQPNVFPLTVLLAFIVVIKIIFLLWPYLPISWLLNTFKVLFRAINDTCRSKKIYGKGSDDGKLQGYDLVMANDPLRQEMAPFTGIYFQYLGDKNAIPTKCVDMCAFGMSKGLHDRLTEGEHLEGWISLDQDNYVVKSKQWDHTVMINGVSRIKGDLKRTYEVIHDVGGASYHLKNVPRYHLAWYGLVEGASNVHDHKHDKQSGKKRGNDHKPEEIWRPSDNDGKHASGKKPVQAEEESDDDEEESEEESDEEDEEEDDE